MALRRLALLGLPLLLLASCSKGVKTGVSDRDEVTRVMAGKDVVDAKHGKEVWLATGAVTGTGGINANGVVIAHVFADGSSTFTLNLNAYAPKEGLQYVAWVMKPDHTDPLNMGYLTSPTGDARHQLTFMTDRDLQAFTLVEITLETKGSTQRTGPLQAVATLKKQTR